ncbi:hypothetical protein [Kitasatospora sp. NBC_01302]|uniref:hypothetical protein n=1 Tax=Kitasatospora sp. NBC_01302 TaxID=2903575 RepID=UPI002E0D92B6|nr:hypothetical protein OG294_13790 [Kitasatospora sp. NBC_01302]
MPWFKIDDGFHCHPKVFAAGTPAIGLYVRCGSWAAQQTSDGIVPKAVARMYGTPRMIRALIDAGMWHEKGHGCESCPQLDANSYLIHQYLAFNPSRNSVDAERAAKTERQRRWREGRRVNGQFTDGAGREPDDDGDAHVDASTPPSVDASVDPPVDATPTRPDPSPTTSSNEEVGERPQPEAADTQPTRVDVERACQTLADRIEANGSRRPVINKRWRDAARLMLDRDGRTLDQLLAAIDWCQKDEFWRTNILSMPSLRKQYERLRLQAQRQQEGPLGRTGTGGYQPYSNPVDQSAYDEWN